MERGADLKALAHVMMGACKSEICRAGWRPREEWLRWMVQLHRKAVCWQNSPFTKGTPSFLC